MKLYKYGIVVAAVSAGKCNYIENVFTLEGILKHGPDAERWSSYRYSKCDQQPLGDGHCLPEGTVCQQIKCYRYNQYFVTDSQCQCAINDDGVEVCGWSTLPDCPLGCEKPGSIAAPSISRCRQQANNRFGGRATHEVDGVEYYFPGQQCRQVRCPSGRRPNKLVVANWTQSRANNPFERKLKKNHGMSCECRETRNGIACDWIGGELGSRSGTSKNTLGHFGVQCAEWGDFSEWSECQNGRHHRKRKCYESLVSYDTHKGAQGWYADPYSKEATPGIDCLPTEVNGKTVSDLEIRRC
jgi:hypothetical protein